MKRLTKKQWVRKYHYLWNKLDKLLKGVNPCEFNKNTCRCIRFHRKPKHWDDHCCHGCKHLSSTGCTVKSLMCKTWFCGWMKQKYPKLYKEMQKINLIAQTELGISQWAIRNSIDETYKDTLEDSYLGQKILIKG